MRHQAGGKLGAAIIMGSLFEALMKISRLTLLHAGKKSVSQLDRAVRECRTVTLYLCTNWRVTRLGNYLVVSAYPGPYSSAVSLRAAAEGHCAPGIGCHLRTCFSSSAPEGWLLAARTSRNGHSGVRHSMMYRVRSELRPRPASWRRDGRSGDPYSSATPRAWTAESLSVWERAACFCASSQYTYLV